MTEEEKKKRLALLRKKLDFVNKLRLAFLFIALILVLLIFWGNKLFDGQAWYAAFTQKSYAIAFWDLLFMLIASFTKLWIAMRYNHIAKTM